jgi:hypothetical protein
MRATVRVLIARIFERFPPKDLAIFFIDHNHHVDLRSISWCW